MNGLIELIVRRQRVLEESGALQDAHNPLLPGSIPTREHSARNLEACVALDG